MRRSAKYPYFLLLILASWCAVSTAQEPPGVLDLPKLMREQEMERLRGIQLLQSGQRQEALALFQRGAERMPFDAMAHYHLACAQALLDQSEPALGSLRTAVAFGFRTREALLKEGSLDSLRNLPEFEELLAACKTPPPAEVPGWKYSVTAAKPDKGSLKLQPSNMMWSPTGKILQVFVDLSDAGEGKPISDARDEVGKLLKRWFAEGSAAGNLGDLYDNHDRGHSTLQLGSFPQFTRIEYSDELKERNLDNGLQCHFAYTHAERATAAAAPAEKDDAAANLTAKSLKIERAVVLGNSSTALTGTALWRSMPRLALTTYGGSEILFEHYLNNHVYVYPEHRDHDPGHDAKSGWGDVFFANTPYYVISQGSSGSDQPFLQALAATLAAFPKDTKDQLRSSGILAPTLQMILRRCTRQVQSNEDYLSGLAHPTVFEAAQLDTQRMVRMAHELKPAHVPPLVLLKVQSEDVGDPHRDYFDSNPREGLLTSPCAIARAGFSTKYWREIRIRASTYGGAKGKPAEFRWVVLRGDPERIEIKPLDGDPNARTIRVGYHPRRPVAPGSSMESSRVDIGVFAYNGQHYSAPSFVSFYFPDNEVRQYDAQQRILSVDYVQAADNYADPAIVTRRDWRDEYHYDSSGAQTGWTRIRGDAREEFNADGKLIVTHGGREDARKSSQVRYERIVNPDRSQSIKQVTIQ